MKKIRLSLVTLLLLSQAVAFAADLPASPRSNVTPLSNKDVLIMVERKIEAEVIVKTIKSSPCTFDTFPPVLQDLKRRGVPETVLQAMIESPYGPSLESSSADDLAEQPIYHYAEQLKQMGILTTSSPSRGARGSSRRPERAKASRPSRRKY